MNKFHKIAGRYCATVECPDCHEKHDIAHKNYYGHTFRCDACAKMKSHRTRRNPALRKTAHGYVKLYRPENPMADKRGEIYEHRLIMSEHLGRPLKRFEHVHHKNGNRTDNKIGNLELLPGIEHGTIRDMKNRIAYLENLLVSHNIVF